MRPRMFGFAVFAISAVLPCAHGASFPALGGGGGFNGSGTFYTTANANGSETIVNVTGTGVTGLLGPGSFNGNDNLLSPDANPVLDGEGVSFTDTMGDTSFDVNLFSAGQNSYFAKYLDSDGVTGQVAVNLEVTDVPLASPTLRVNLAGALQGGPVLTRRFSFVAEPAVATAVTPEPSSIALLGTGLLGIAGVVRKRLRA